MSGRAAAVARAVANAWRAGWRSLANPKTGGQISAAFKHSDFLGGSAGFGGSLYPSCDARRLLLDEMRGVGTLSPDGQLVPSVVQLRAQGAKMDAATPLGRGAVEGLAAQLVGSGVDVLSRAADPELRKLAQGEWRAWAAAAGTNGETLWTLQGQAARALQRSGGCLWRWVQLPERLDEGLLPDAILALPIEWLAREPVAELAEGQVFIAGTVFDRYHRAVAYDLRDPCAPHTPGERVPAGEIIHIYEPRLPGQSLGEPGLASLIERLHQDGESVVQEMRAALVANAPSVFTTTEAATGTDSAGNPIDKIPVGSFIRGFEGETFHQIASERPNTKLPEFRGTVRGDVAAAARVSQDMLDRDSGRASWSSSRRDQQITDRLMALLGHEFNKAVATAPYLRVLRSVVLQSGRRWPTRRLEVRAVTRHQVLPDKQVSANPWEQARTDDLEIARGTKSPQEIILRSGRDPEEVAAERAEYNETLRAAGLPEMTTLVAKLAAEADVGAAGGAAPTDPAAGSAESIESQESPNA